MEVCKFTANAILTQAICCTNNEQIYEQYLVYRISAARTWVLNLGGLVKKRLGKRMRASFTRFLTSIRPFVSLTIKFDFKSIGQRLFSKPLTF